MSEFGTGFAYCLGLFLCHDERRARYQESRSDYVKERGKPSYDIYSASLWFNGAADHLFDMVIPDSFSHKELAEEFKSKCLNWRNEWEVKATWEDAQWAIQTAKDLLRAWDAQCGIESEKGDYE